MNADTVTATPLTLRVAAALLDLARDPHRPAATLTVDGLATPEMVLRFAAGILGAHQPHTTPGRLRAELAAVRVELHAAGALAGELEEDNARLVRVRRLAVDLHDLLGQTVAHLADLHQVNGWHYDRARLLDDARTLLDRDPWGGDDHAQQHAELRDAERLRVAAYTIQTADALHQAARAGDTERLGRAAEGYERARRLFAQHAAADTHQLTRVVIDTTLDHDPEPADVHAASVGCAE